MRERERELCNNKKYSSNKFVFLGPILRRIVELVFNFPCILQRTIKLFTWQTIYKSLYYRIKGYITLISHPISINQLCVFQVHFCMTVIIHTYIHTYIYIYIYFFLNSNRSITFLSLSLSLAILLAFFCFTLYVIIGFPRK